MEQHKLYDTGEKLCYWLVPEICNTNVVNLQGADVYAKAFVCQTKTSNESVKLAVIPIRNFSGVTYKFSGMAFITTFQKIETCPDGFVPMQNVVDFLYS